MEHLPCVIIPKAAILPKTKVRTGAANARNDLEVTLCSCFSSWVDFTRSFLIAGLNMAIVPAHWAKSVAIAAPAKKKEIISFCR